MGSGKKQTVGYRYFMGIQFAVCYGPVDALERIESDKRVAWRGIKSSSGPITINEPNLFGGDDREGGLAGVVQVCMGASNQGKDSYLVSQLGEQIPAYRGVFSAILYGPSTVQSDVPEYEGGWSVLSTSLRSGPKTGLVAANNPYLKPWSFRVRRILAGWNCGSAWYPETAPIGNQWTYPQAIVIALDISGSMNDETPNGETRAHNAKVAISGLLDYILALTQESGLPLDLMGVGWGSYTTTITRRSVTADDIQDIKDWFDDLDINGTETDFVFATDPAPAFFAGAPEDCDKTFIFITDGVPSRTGYPFPMDPEDAEMVAREAADTLFSVDGVQSFAFNIDLSDTTYSSFLDNTPADGVPVVPGSDPDALTDSIAAALGGAHYDMNGAHIVYQCLTDPQWGMGYPISSIDEAYFTRAADTLFSEDFGLSMIWNQQSSIEDFIQIVLDHIGGVLRIDPVTGKFQLVLIRGDYSLSDLITLDETNILSMDSFQRAGYGETVNEISVVYTDRNNGQSLSVTVQDLANIQSQGAVVSQTKQYPGIRSNDIAGRVAMRDLVAQSTLLSKATMKVNREGALIRVGDVILVSWPKLGITAVPMRVLSVNTGTLEDGAVTIQAAEDVFGLPLATYSNQQDSLWTPPDNSADPIEKQDVLEATYWDMARAVGDDPDAPLVSALDADAGFVRTLAARENGLWQSYRINSKVGSTDYVEQTVGQFAPTAILSGSITEQDDFLEFENAIDLNSVTEGTLVLIGSGREAEWVEFLGLDSNQTGMNVARGVLDTVPKDWPSLTRIWFTDNALGADPTERATGDVVDVKLQTLATGGAVDLEDAEPMQITLAQRMARPYPPGNVKVNGQTWPGPIDDPIEITWAHRDRVQQTAYLVHQGEGNIGPEPGTTYTVYLYNNDTDELLLQSGPISGTEWEPDFSAAGEIRVEIESVRAGIPSWQRQIRVIEFGYAEDVRLLEDGSFRLLEDGGLRLLENAVINPDAVFYPDISIEPYFPTIVRGDGSYLYSYTSSPRAPVASAISVLDKDTYEEIATVTNQETLTGFLLVTADAVYTQYYDNLVNTGFVTRFDATALQAGTISRIKVPPGGGSGSAVQASMAILGQNLFVASGGLFVLDKDTMADVDTIDMAVVTGIPGICYAVTTDATHVYAVQNSWTTSTLAKMEPDGDVVWTVADIPRYGIELVHAQGKIWMMGQEDVRVFSAADGSLLKTIPCWYNGDSGEKGPFCPQGPRGHLYFDGTNIYAYSRYTVTAQQIVSGPPSYTTTVIDAVEYMGVQAFDPVTMDLAFELFPPEAVVRGVNSPPGSDITQVFAGPNGPDMVFSNAVYKRSQ